VRRLGAALMLLIVLSTSCSSSVHVSETENTNGLCKITRERKFLGIQYSSSQAFQNC